MTRLILILVLALAAAPHVHAQGALTKDHLSKIIAIYDQHAQPSTIEGEVAKALRLPAGAKDAPLKNISIEDTWGYAAFYRVGTGYVFGRADRDGTTRLYHADAQLRPVAGVALTTDGIRQLTANESSAGLARELGAWAAVAGSL